LQARWRLLLGTVLCVLLVLLLPDGYRLVSRLLMGWDAGVALYLVLVMAMIVNSDTSRVRRQSALQDEGRIAIPILTVTAAVASLAAIVFWLRTSGKGEIDELRILALLFLTILLSWSFIHVMLRCITRMNITPSIAAKAEACASPGIPTRITGTFSISPSPSARPRKSPTWR
jgi:uncharacterized membrane protein